MIEEYGTLSEEELIQEIVNELEESDEIDPSDLDFKFEEDKLKITGTLQNEDELEVLISVLEDYVDPKDYQCDVELMEEGVDSSLTKRRPARDPEEDFEDEEEEDEEDFDEEGFEEVDEDEADFDEDLEDEDAGEDEDKW